ncbi:DUF935 domain-containing protein [Vibrio mediterranei]
MKRNSPIVDVYGKPIEISVLDEPQTEQSAKLAELRRHYASHPSSGLSPSKLARIMKAAEQGDLVAQSELAEDMEEKDAHIQSELSKRKMALQGVDWSIKPPRNASKDEQYDAELLQELMEDATWFDDLIFDMSDAILKGYSCTELEWGFSEGVHYIENTTHRDPAWFQTHPDSRNELRLRDGSHEGEMLQPFGWVTHIARAKSGYVSRSGLARVLAWPFLFKNYSVRDLAEFLEIYGLPVRVGKYPEGATEREKLTLLRAVMSIGHNAGGIIPKGMDIDFQDAATGSPESFMAMIGWCEKSQSKAILGGTLTSQADGKASTNALGNVHNEVRQEIRDFDLKRLAATLTRDVVYPQYVLNGKSFRSPRRKPTFEFDIAEAEDIKHLSDSLPGLVGLGMQIPISWVHDKTQIPTAKDGEPVLMQQSSAPTPLSTASLKATVQPTPKADVVDKQVSTLSQAADSLLEMMIEPVRELVEKAESLSDIREGILALQGEIPIEELGEIMAQALAAAELAGIVDVDEGK